MAGFGRNGGLFGAGSDLGRVRVLLSAVEGFYSESVGLQTDSDTKAALSDYLRVSAGNLDKLKDRLWDSNDRQTALEILRLVEVLDSLSQEVLGEFAGERSGKPIDNDPDF